MSEWFSSTGEEHSGKQGVVLEVLCELPPKPTQRVAGALQARQPTAIPATEEHVHDDDLRTFPALGPSEDAPSRKRRLLAHRLASQQLAAAFEAFCRDRDLDDFQRLWNTHLAPHTPQRLLPPLPAPGAASAAPASASPPALPPPPPRRAIPALLLSTNGASPADRLDLYGSFQAFLRESKSAYVALLRPEDLAGGVGGAFTTALAQLSGCEGAAAEDVMGLVEWYEAETGRAAARAAAQAIAAAAHGGGGGGLGPAALGAPTPGKARGAKTPAKTPGKAKGRAAGGRDGDAGPAAGAGDAGEGGEGAEGDGTVAARLRQRRGAPGGGAAAQSAAAEAEAAARAARAAAAAARNARRHVVIVLEGAARVADRGALRALLAALHAERARLPVVLVLGLSCPAALFASQLPADLAGLLAPQAAELAPQPAQLHRLFEDVLLRPAPGPALLPAGGAARELLGQARLLEPSLAGLQAALLEAHEQHFRSQPLSHLAVLPLQWAMAGAAGGQAWKGGGGADEAQVAGRDKGRAPVPGAQRCRLRAAAGAPGSPTSSDGSFRSASSGGGSDGAEDDGSGGEGGDGCGGGGSGPVEDEAGLEARRRRHTEQLAAEVAALPHDLMRAAAAALTDGGGGGAAEGGGRGAAGGAAAAVTEAVAAAYGALGAWRLGVRWLARLGERTGALQQPGGYQRYSLPALYCAAAGPRLWAPQPPAPGLPSAAAASPAPSVGESLLGGVLGAAGERGGRSRGVRGLGDLELDHLLEELAEAAGEALSGWMPHPCALAAARGLQDLRRAAQEDTSGPGAEAGAGAEAEGAGQGAGSQGQGAGAADAGPDSLVSPLRRRLAAQGLASPPTAAKLKRITEGLAQMESQPPPQPALPRPEPAAPARAPAARKAGPGGQTLKLPSSGQTQSKRQRDLALQCAVQQRAAAGGVAPAGAAEAAGAAAAAAAPAAQSPSERAAEWLGATLRELLRECPFNMPGSAAFACVDARALQRRLLGAPAMALHSALLRPEDFLPELQPGLHPAQEDAAAAYQLLAGCREGLDLRDWLADFAAASGMGRMQEMAPEPDDEEGDDQAADGDRPMGRSRKSGRRAAPRKRKAVPKQVLVLDLDGPGAEAAVDAVAARFEAAVRQLEAVGLCRLAKRRKGTFVQRTYFPPEVLA